MAVELKVIFEKLGNVKKQIEDGFKSGINLETKTQTSAFGQQIEKLNKQLQKTYKLQEKNFRAETMMRKQQQVLANSNKQLEHKLINNPLISSIDALKNKLINTKEQLEKNKDVEKLTLNRQKILNVSTKQLELKLSENQKQFSEVMQKIEKYNQFARKLGKQNEPSKLRDKLENRMNKLSLESGKIKATIEKNNNTFQQQQEKLINNTYNNERLTSEIQKIQSKINSTQEKLVNENEKIKLAIDKNNIISENQSAKLTAIMEENAMLIGEQAAIMEEQSMLQQAMLDSFSTADKILYKIYDRLGMQKSKDKLIDKRLGGDMSGIDVGKKKGGTSTGGMIGLAAIAGGVIGLLSQLIQSTKAIQFVLEFIGGLLNMLLAPILLVVLTLLKPFLIMFLLLSKFLFDFFMDPSKALQGLWESIKTGLSNLLGFGGKDKQKEAGAGIGAVAGAGIGFAVGGPLGAFIGAMIGPIIGKLAVGLGEWIGKLLGEFTLWLDKITGGAVAQQIEGIINFFKGIWELFAGIFTLDWERIKEGFFMMFSGLWDIATTPLKAAFNVLKGIGKWLWDNILIPILSTAWEILKNIGTWLWEEILKPILSTGWDILSTIGNWIYDTITGILATSLNVLSDIGSWIKDKITNLWDGIKAKGSSLLQSAKSSVGINDGVVSPNGRIISINPKDYLIATKRPQDLMGGNSRGNNITINLTVNGNADRSMIDMIKRELRRELGQRGAF